MAVAGAVAATARSAASRAVVVGKKMRTDVSSSSTAVGPKSSMRASRRSEEPVWTSIAGQLLPKHVLHAIEEVPFVLLLLVACARFELFLRQRFRQLLEQLPLLLVQPVRRLHLHRREHVAVSAAVHVGHPLAAQAERGSGLRPLRNLHLFRTIQCRHQDFSAERHGGEVDWNLAEQVVAVAAEERVLLHVDDNVEVAGGTASRSRFALALQAQLLSGGDAFRNLDCDLPLLRDAPGAAAGLARIADDLPGAAALRAGARHGEEPLLEPDLPLPAALRTLARRRAGRRSRSVTRLAVLLPRNLNRRLGPDRRFFEGDLEVVAQIGAALRTAAAPAAAKEIAEAEDVAEPAKDVFEAGEDRRIEAARARR